MTKSPPNDRLHVYATKPEGEVALALSDLGITVDPLEEEAANVDRYIVSQRLAIERRTAHAFLQGIQDKSLFTSAIALHEQFEIPLLILEGEVDYAYTSFHPQAVRGALTALVLHYGLSLLTSSEVDETAHLIAMAARQEQVGIPEISLVPKRRATDLPDLQRRVVEMLPGCGLVVARDLLHHFGSVQRIAAATEEQLRRVRGIGAQKAADIHRVLHAEYAAIDTERNLEDAIEAEPTLLFERPLPLLARQLHIGTPAGDRDRVDLVFWDEPAQELILVELKLGPLTPDHYGQIRRYLEHAPASPVLRPYLQAGARLRGILATVTESEYSSEGDAVTTYRIDADRVIQVLQRLRQERLAQG